MNVVWLSSANRMAESKQVAVLLGFSQHARIVCTYDVRTMIQTKKRDIPHNATVHWMEITHLW